MEFLELVKKRYSVREFSERPVEKEKIEAMLEAARLAPSAVNYQPRHFVVITDGDLRAQIGQAYAKDWLQKAPVLIVVLGDHSRAWRRRDGKSHCDIDAAIAIDHLTLAAASLGLGTCWVCAFDAGRVHSVLGLPPHLEAIALLPVGYPASDRIPGKERKDLAELVSWNGFGRKCRASR